MHDHFVSNLEIADLYPHNVLLVSKFDENAAYENRDTILSDLSPLLQSLIHHGHEGGLRDFDYFRYNQYLNSIILYCSDVFILKNIFDMHSGDYILLITL